MIKIFKQIKWDKVGELQPCWALLSSTTMQMLITWLQIKIPPYTSSPKQAHFITLNSVITIVSWI